MLVRACLYFVLLSFSSALFAKKKSLNFLPKKGLVEESIQLVRVLDGKVLFQKNSGKLLIPASISKIFGAACFLKEFGGRHRFVTEFYVNKKNDLIARGSGDPLLVSEDLWKIAFDLKHLGFKKFRNLVIDNSLFRDEESNKRKQKSSLNSYDASLSAFGVNFNTYEMAVSPGSKIREKAKVAFYPYLLEGVPLRNSLVTVGGKGKEKIQVRRALDKKGEFLEVSGTIKVTSSLKKYNRSSYDPLTLSGGTLRAFLKGVGISVEGEVKEGGFSSYEKETPVLSYPGKTVAYHVSGLMAYSNNYMTDMLVDALGAYSSKKKDESTYELGIGLIEKLLKFYKVPLKGFVLKNASGLSPKNRMSASQVTDFLVKVAKDFSLFPDFLASFTVPGAEGSLKDRFKGLGVDLIGRIRLKTGTRITPVSTSSLAGYVDHPQHGLVAVAVIQNGVKGRAQPNLLEMRKAQDDGLINFFESK